MNLSDAFDVRRTLRPDLGQGTAERIRARLVDLGMSETQLGKAIGLSQAGVSRRFVGLSRWEAHELEAVARVLKTSVKRLVIPAP